MFWQSCFQTKRYVFFLLFVSLAKASMNEKSVSMMSCKEFLAEMSLSCHCIHNKVGVSIAMNMSSPVFGQDQEKRGRKKKKTHVLPIKTCGMMRSLVSGSRQCWILLVMSKRMQLALSSLSNLVCKWVIRRNQFLKDCNIRLDVWMFLLSPRSQMIKLHISNSIPYQKEKVENTTHFPFFFFHVHTMHSC